MLDAIVTSRWCSFATDTQPLTSLKNTQNTDGLLLLFFHVHSWEPPCHFVSG